MTHKQNICIETNNTDAWNKTGYQTVKNIYILYIISFIFGITAIIGVFIAYSKRDNANEVISSHYQYQIRTFWIALIFTILCFALNVAILLIVLNIWWLIRTFKGLKAITNNKGIENPNTWLF